MKKIIIVALALSCYYANAQVDQSPLTPIILKTPVTPPTTAQATQQLLWYRGKKVNDSILVTPSNTLVLYSRKRDLVIVQPEKKKDPAIKLVNELARSEARKKEYFSGVTKQRISIMWYPAVENTLKQLDDLTSSYNEMLKNQVKLPSVINASTAFNNSSHGGYASAIPKFRYELIPEEVRRVYNQVMSLMKNYPPISFDAPPAREFGACFNCDTTRSNNYNSEVNRWRKEFSKYEDEIAQLAISVVRTLQTPPNTTDAESAKMITDMGMALEFAANRLRNKIDLLIRNHGNDYSKLESVIKTALSVERQRQLLGFGDEKSYGELISKLLPLFDQYDSYLLKQMQEKNYDFVLDMPFHIAMQRQKQLLGGDEAGFNQYIDRFNAFNRFKVEMTMDYEGEYYGCNSPSREKAHAKSKDLYVSLGLVNCKYRFFLPNEYNQHPAYHFGRRFNFIMDITSGVYTYRFSNDEDKCEEKIYNYTGLEVRPYAPIASFTFCQDEQDSLQLMGMHLGMSREDVKGAKMFSMFSLLYRDDPDASGDFPQRVIDASTELEEINKLIGQYEMNPDHSALTENKMRNMYDITVRREEALRILHEFDDTRRQSLIMFDAQNRSAVLLDEKTTLKYDGGEDSDKFKIDIKIRIVHDPLPFK